MTTSPFRRLRFGVLLLALVLVGCGPGYQKGANSGEDKPKAADAKAEVKPADLKPADLKPADLKPADVKPADAKTEKK